jgi:conjugal transfer pilus assembly protein TraW
MADKKVSELMPVCNRSNMQKIVLGVIVSVFISGGLLSTSTIAGDFGTYGQTFPVKEKSTIEAIQEKFQGMMDSGEWDKHAATYKEKTLDSIKNPLSKEIPHVITNKTRYFDPTVEVLEDIPLPDGRFLARRGDKINPLAQLGLSKDILFFDATNAKQLQWAVDHKKKDPSTIAIATKGNWFKAMEENGVRFYFDQQGHLTDRFDIQRVPSKVSQDDRKLKIEEVAL